jgi:predicted ATPase
MSCDPTAERFHQLVKQGRNVLLTGQAGTGKSTLLRNEINADDETVAITASTGIAALNISGSTIHRWSGMMLGPKRGDDPTHVPSRTDARQTPVGACRYGSHSQLSSAGAR